MPKRLRRRALATLLPVLCVPVADAAAADRTPQAVPGQYIVLYENAVADPGAETDARERRDGFKAKLRYSRAVKGFAAKLNRNQVERLRADAAVAVVAPDLEVRATAALAAGDSAPTGVRRMQAATTTTARDASTANVAVIDTGIDLDHPDLTVAGGRNCVTPGAAPDDDNGHGTHVAGSIAARNDGAGVVGIAPGTRVFAAKVLDRAGSGTTSQVICGIDWVTSTRTDADTTNDITVANMSLGGAGSPVGTCSSTSDPQHRAICSSIARGVTYVVAAGNSGWDFDYASNPDLPAAYPEVLTVSAVSDSDGLSGGTGGAPACRTGETDEKFASFSNYARTAAGAAHLIAAPGVCIRSTWPGGGYNTISGTSMASPHVAGAAALCLGEQGTTTAPCAGMTPAQIVAKLRSDAAAHNQATTTFGFSGDPLRPVSGRTYGYLQHVGAGTTTGTEPEPTPEPTPEPSTVAVSAVPARTTIQTGSPFSGSVADLASDDGALYRVSSTTKRTRQSAWYGTFAGVPSTLSGLKVTYKGANSLPCAQTVEIYRHTDGQWVGLDQRTVGTTQVLIGDVAVNGTQADYRSSAGDVHVRVRCSTTSGSFTTSGDLLRIAYARPA